MLQLNARLTQTQAASVQSISIPRPRHRIVCRVSSRDRNGFPAKHLPRPQTGSTEQYQSSTNNPALPILDEASAARASYSLSCKGGGTSVVAASDRHMRARSPVNSLCLCLISLPCIASPTTPSLLRQALNSSSCFFNVIELLLSLVSRFTPTSIPHSRLPHPHYANPQPPCTPDSISTLILCSTATQRHHGSSRRRPPFRQPQLRSL